MGASLAMARANVFPSDPSSGYLSQACPTPHKTDTGHHQSVGPSNLKAKHTIACVELEFPVRPAAPPADRQAAGSVLTCVNATTELEEPNTSQPNSQTRSNVTYTSTSSICAATVSMSRVIDDLVGVPKTSDSQTTSSAFTLGAPQ